MWYLLSVKGQSRSETLCNKMKTDQFKAVQVDVYPSNKTNRYSYRGWIIVADAFGDPRNARMRRQWRIVNVNGDYVSEVWGGLAGAKRAIDGRLALAPSL